MSEQKPSKIEIQDIVTPKLGIGDTSIVFQRHGVYSRDRGAENAGSITPESAEAMRLHDLKFFKEVLDQPDVYVLFTSSDTQYAEKGYRSLETAQVAQDAAVEAMLDADIDPTQRIINFNPEYKTATHEPTDQAIRPIYGVREPQIFHPDDKAYLTHLGETYGYADEENKAGLSPRAWGMHEMDAVPEERKKTGAEGQNDLIDRTESSLAILERYARIWHVNNPGKRLVIWTASHYDTINPLAKKVDGTLRNPDGTLTDAYQSVDYGGGVIINVPAESEKEKTLQRRDGEKTIQLGKSAVGNGLTKLNRPNY